MKNVFLLLLIPLGTLIHGFVLSNLWGWFVVPVTGLPEIGWATAAGLSLFMHYGIKSNDTLETAEEIAKYVINRMIALPAVVLLVGWLLSIIAS